MSAARFPWAIFVGVMTAALILRSPIVSVAPVARELGADLTMSAGLVGLLTTIPVLCFAVFAVPASWLVGRIGPNLTLTLTIVGIGTGILLRWIPGIGPLFAGTVLLGVGIAVGNVVIPVIVHRDIPPERLTTTMGAYTVALNVGATIASFATAPLALVFGWESALGSWVGLVVIALVAWLVALQAVKRIPVTGDPGPVDVPTEAQDSPRRVVVSTIILCVAFGGQAFGFYGVSAWLPAIVADTAGFSATAAGAAASVFQLLGIVGGLAVPALAGRLGMARTVVIVDSGWLMFAIGFLVLPRLWPVWVVVGGIAQAAGITVIFALMVHIASSQRHSRRLSGIVQGVGYAVAAVAPTALGAAHDATGAWTTSIAFVLVAVVFNMVFAFWGARRAEAIDPVDRSRAPAKGGSQIAAEDSVRRDR